MLLYVSMNSLFQDGESYRLKVTKVATMAEKSKFGDEGPMIYNLSGQKDPVEVTFTK